MGVITQDKSNQKNTINGFINIKTKKRTNQLNDWFAFNYGGGGI